jgi:hypothetical protein
VGVFELPEPELDLGLGAVGGHDVGGWPVVTVGEQDPLAEQPAFQAVAGAGVASPGQAQLGRVLPGQGGGD